MTTRELALTVCTDDALVEQVYRKLLLFIINRQSGYGVSSGDRGKARRHAERHGYFWLPCLICGNWFGGHELAESSGRSVPVGAGQGVCVCPRLECNAEAARLTTLYPNGLENP